MTDDPYQIIGVAKGASSDAIRKAYRKLAKELHPDKNPGDEAAEENFKAVQAAYDLLKDDEKRARFDRGEIDASGQERSHRQYSYRDFADAGAARAYHAAAGNADTDDMAGIFADLFGDRRRGGFAGFGGARGGADVHMPGNDVRYRYSVDFLDAVNGTKTRINMPDGKALDLTIPPGLNDGQTLRLKGKGEPGVGDAPAGDALVEVEVRPHHLFRRDGDTIELDLPVSLSEAVLGGKIKVPTPQGPVTMTVPKGANSGRKLRLKAKGVQRGKGGKRGDLYVVLHVMLPDSIDDDLADLVGRWSKDHAYDPRKDIKT